MDSKKPATESAQQSPKDTSAPQPGTQRKTVEETVDLMKRLAEFNSQKEEMLKKLSAIGEKMQKRLGDLKTNKPSAKEMIEAEVAEAKAALQQQQQQIKPSNASLPPHLHGVMGAMPQYPPVGNTPSNHNTTPKLAYTRVRETNRPAFVDGCFSIALPNKQAITDEWKGLVAKAGDHSIASGSVNYTEDGIELSTGCSMTIATGLKISLPINVGLRLESMSGLSVVAPILVTHHFKEKELLVTVRNDTTDSLTLLYGIPLFAAYPVQLCDQLVTEELLNSTYEDWVHGTIQG